MAVSEMWERTPVAWRFAVGIALFFQVCSLSSSNSRTVNGVMVECSYLDLGKLAAAAITVVLLGVGAVTVSRSQTPPPTGLTAGVVGVTALLVILLVVRGLGLVGGPCAGVESASLLLG